MIGTLRAKGEVGIGSSRSQRQGIADHALWTALPEKMTTWRHRGCFTKQSRWFSWNGTATESVPEFTASRMVLEVYLACEQSTDDIQRPHLYFKDAAGL